MCIRDSFYATGTVMGAPQLNISNLQSPVFSLSAIPAGGNAVIELLLTADCVAATVLDTGGLLPVPFTHLMRPQRGLV